MSAGQGPAPAGNGGRHYLIYVWLGVLTIFFVAVVAIDLENYRPISVDGGWVLSASYKLAKQGVFGSDIFAGFFSAEEHYFIALPGQHVLQALFMRLFGYGISQARWASVLAGIVLLWSVSILALRWYGTTVAGLTSLLLLFWQQALVGEGTVPLVSLARSLRYDLPAVAWIWLTLLFLDGWLRRPKPARALVTGVAAAAATLTQFFGSVILLIVPLAVLAHRRKQIPSAADVGAWLLGFISLAGPYFLYASTYWQDAVGQTVYLKGERASLGLGAVWRNVIREPQRYQYFVEQIDVAPGPWLLLLGVVPACAYLGIRLRQSGDHGARILALTIVTTALFLTLIDATKAPIYLLPLLPPLCVIFALLATRLLRKASRRPDRQGIALSVAVIMLLSLSILHGFHFYFRDFRAASSVSDYHALGKALQDEIEPGAAITGSERWWWPLRDRRFLALNNLSLQWRVRRDRAGQTPSISSLLAENGTGHIVLDVNARGDMERTPQRLQEQFWAYIAECTQLKKQWTDATYGEIDLYAVTPACR